MRTFKKVWLAEKIASLGKRKFPSLKKWKFFVVKRHKSEQCLKLEGAPKKLDFSCF